jgi:hypothetical protein
VTGRYWLDSCTVRVGKVVLVPPAAGQAPPVAAPPVALPPVAVAPVAEPPLALPPVGAPPVALPPVETPPTAMPPELAPPLLVVIPPVAESTPPVAALPPVVEAVLVCGSLAHSLVPACPPTRVDFSGNVAMSPTLACIRRGSAGRDAAASPTERGTRRVHSATAPMERAAPEMSKNPSQTAVVIIPYVAGNTKATFPDKMKPIPTSRPETGNERSGTLGLGSRPCTSS